MRKARLWAWLGVLVVCASLARLSAQEGPLLSRVAYVAELGRLRQAVDTLTEARPEVADALLTTVPRASRVDVDGEIIDVSWTWLRTDVLAWRRQPTPEFRQAIVQTLDWLAREATLTPPAPGDTDARARLTAILEAREFAQVRKPSRFAELRRRVIAFLLNLLGRMVTASSVPSLARLLVYLIAILAVLVVGLWIFGVIRRQRPEDVFGRMAPPTPMRPWQTWLSDADSAAANHQWREAVHLAYWAAIFSLEARGVWKPDASRTPREYLRLPTMPTDARPPLAALTRLVEQVWYGRIEATAATFDQARDALRGLGCLPR